MPWLLPQLPLYLFVLPDIALLHFRKPQLFLVLAPLLPLWPLSWLVLHSFTS